MPRIVQALVAGSLLAPAACEMPAPSNKAVEVERPEKAQINTLRIDVARLVDADKAAVAAILGEPASCHMESRGESCAYEANAPPPEALEVFFIGGRAANLTLPSFGLPFEQASLRAYGIEAGQPSFISPAVTRWHVTINSTPIEVDMFPDGDGGIHYVYLMARR